MMDATLNRDRGSVVLGALTSHLKRGPAMGETLERAVAARAELQANLDAHLLLKRRNEAALIALGQVERAASPLHALYALAHAFAPPIFGCEHASLWLIRQSKSRVADVVASRGRSGRSSSTGQWAAKTPEAPLRRQPTAHPRRIWCCPSTRPPLWARR